MMVPSQPPSDASNVRVGPASPRPSAVSGAPTTTLVADPGAAWVFHKRYGVPSRSTNTSGSIEPPRSASHTSGAAVLSTNTAFAAGAVAYVRHHWLLTRSRAA